MFYLRYNHAGCRAYVCQANEEPMPWYEWVSTHTTLEGARVAMEALRGEPRWAVFYDMARGHGFVDQVDDLAGNYKGSQPAPAHFCAEFPSEREAREYLATF